MASPVSPNLWPNLASLGLPEADGTDARAALLKINAGMFVAAPARDRESIQTFEALVLGFLPRVDDTTLLDLARILAPCEDTPASILDYLAKHSAEARRTLLRHATRLPLPLRRKLLATREGRLQLALRPDLDESLARSLLVLRERETEDALASNPGFSPECPAFKELARRAQSRPALARTLLARGDLPETEEASLYLAADAKRRARIRDRIEHFSAKWIRLAAPECLSTRKRADTTPVKTAPAGTISLQGAIPSCALSEHAIGALLAACREEDVQRVEELLNGGFGFPARTEWRILEMGRHRLLALALKALDVPRKDAVKIFLTLHPTLSSPLSALRALMREMRDVPGPVARALVEAILHARSLPGQSRIL